MNSTLQEGERLGHQALCPVVACKLVSDSSSVICENVLTKSMLNDVTNVTDKPTITNTINSNYNHRCSNNKKSNYSNSNSDSINSSSHSDINNVNTDCQRNNNIYTIVFLGVLVYKVQK